MRKDKNKFVGWVTKYALTSGITQTELLHDAESPDMVEAPGMGQFGYFHGEGRDWHRTKDGAIKRAETMRTKQIQSLEKKIKVLQKKNFK